MKEKIGRFLDVILFPFGTIAIILNLIMPEKTLVNIVLIAMILPAWTISLIWWIKNSPIQISIKFKKQ